MAVQLLLRDVQSAGQLLAHVRADRKVCAPLGQELDGLLVQASCSVSVIDCLSGRRIDISRYEVLKVLKFYRIITNKCNNVINVIRLHSWIVTST